MPFWSQILLLGCVGACVGGQLNRAIYRWAIFHKRSISPWSAPPENAPPRHWQDRIPLVGWCGLRREVSLHGPGFWVRPLLIELFVAVGFPLQYWWEMSGGLIPPGFPQPSTSVLMASCAVHVLLFCLMFIGSFIDLDEKTIPDEVTVLGALAGLILAALLPHAMLPNPLHGPPAIIRPLWLADPWPAWLHTSWGLAIGWSCFLGWLYAIVPKIWRTRGGLIKALRILVASLRRYAVNWTTGIGLVVGCVSIAGIWWVGGLHWRALLTSLVGLAFGGGMIWAVRIIGTVALRREAMGFGDVTLMAMVGAFVRAGRRTGRGDPRGRMRFGLDAVLVTDPAIRVCWRMCGGSTQPCDLPLGNFPQTLDQSLVCSTGECSTAPLAGPDSTGRLVWPAPRSVTARPRVLGAASAN